MVTPKTNKPNSDRLCGTCSTTGKSYHNLTAAQQAQIASVKTLLMRWLGNNAEWEGSEALAIGKRAFAAIGELIRADKFPVAVPASVSKSAGDETPDTPPEPKGKTA